jgi:thiol-disulfide isomerase/thioredoxin
VPSHEVTRRVKKGRIFAIAGLVVALGAGLYLANRFWIASVVSHQVRPGNIKADRKHPAAPDFSLKGINGESVRLADYRGKVLMIDFWATDCGPCREEIPGFVQLQDRYRNQGFAIVGISMDSGPEPVLDFYKEFKMNYAVALDSEDLDQLYGGIIGIPTTFLVGRDGRIYAKHLGMTDPSVFEEEIKTLLAAKSDAEVVDFKRVIERVAD